MVIHDGVAQGVWGDPWRPIYEALGIPVITRASEVEYEPATGDWVAIHRETGTEIGRGRIRAEVIKQEVAWLEARL